MKQIDSTQIQGLTTRELTLLEVQYQKELQKLLLKGASWEETEDLRESIGHVATALYKKMNSQHFSADHPAEGSMRRESFYDENP